MKNILYLLLFATVFLSCKKQDKIEKQNEFERDLSSKKIPFDEFKNQLNSKSASEKQNYFFTYINQDVPKYWVGTTWNFNGTTQIPRKGSLACGYFVTNILKDYGFKIDRVYLAQQASSVMIKKLCSDIKYFSKVKDLEDYVLSQDKNQVYIVGLDFHTGFIVREVKDVYFLHSNYIKNKGVTKEIAQKSVALNQSKSFMIGNLKYK